MDKPMHAPLPWKVQVVWSTSPRASVIVDANGKAVDLRDHANQMLIALAVNEHHKRTEEQRRRSLDEQARAERYGYDTETCLANAAECGGL